MKVLQQKATSTQTQAAAALVVALSGQMGSAVSIHDFPSLGVTWSTNLADSVVRIAPIALQNGYLVATASQVSPFRPLLTHFLTCACYSKYSSL